MSSCPSRFTIVKMHMHELNVTDEVQVKTHLAECVRCRDILAEIQQNESTFNQNINAHTNLLLQTIAQESTEIPSTVIPLEKRKRKTGYIHILIPVAAAAAIVFALYFLPFAKTPSQNTLGYKGNFAATVVAKRGNAQFTVANGSILKENDALRFKIQTSRPGFCYIFNVDSNKEIMSLYPFDDTNGVTAMKIETAGEHSLPNSIVLDNSMGTEHFVILFAPQDFKIDTIAKEATKLITQKTAPKQLKEAQLRIITVKKE